MVSKSFKYTKKNPPPYTQRHPPQKKSWKKMKYDGRIGKEKWKQEQVSWHCLLHSQLELTETLPLEIWLIALE